MCVCSDIIFVTNSFILCLRDLQVLPAHLDFQEELLV